MLDAASPGCLIARDSAPRGIEMNETPPELFVEAFQQLGAISAVLGGLAFASAAALLAVSASTNDPRALDRPASITTGAALTSAACLIVAALTWTLLTVQMVGAAAASQLLPVQQVAALNRPASLAFIAGVIFFFVSVGASGWIASRLLGIVSSAVAVLAGVAALLILFQFVN